MRQPTTSLAGLESLSRAGPRIAATALSLDACLTDAFLIAVNSPGERIPSFGSAGRAGERAGFNSDSGAAAMLPAFWRHQRVSFGDRVRDQHPSSSAADASAIQSPISLFKGAPSRTGSLSSHGSIRAVVCGINDVVWPIMCVQCVACKATVWRDLFICGVQPQDEPVYHLIDHSC
jgi:hypothetical protein